MPIIGNKKGIVTRDPVRGVRQNSARAFQNAPKLRPGYKPPQKIEASLSAGEKKTLNQAKLRVPEASATVPHKAQGSFSMMAPPVPPPQLEPSAEELRSLNTRGYDPYSPAVFKRRRAMIRKLNETTAIDGISERALESILDEMYPESIEAR